MPARMTQASSSLVIDRVGVSACGRTVFAMTADDTMLTFATSAEVDELIEGLGRVKALLQAREAGSAVAA